MKIYLLIATVAGALTTRDCNQAKVQQPATEKVQNASVQIPETFPDCIQQKINEIKKQPKWNPPAQVNAYLYKGKTVYLFSSDCCDQFNALVDSACNYICAPSGGLTGKGDRKCTDFSAEAKLLKQVWKDER